MPRCISRSIRGNSSWARRSEGRQTQHSHRISPASRHASLSLHMHLHRCISICATISRASLQANGHRTRTNMKSLETFRVEQTLSAAATAAAPFTACAAGASP